MAGISRFMIRGELFRLVHKGIHEAEIEESEKAGTQWESNPGHFGLEPPVFCLTTTNTHNPQYVRLMTSKFLYFQCEVRHSEQTSSRLSEHVHNITAQLLNEGLHDYTQ